MDPSDRDQNNLDGGAPDGVHRPKHVSGPRGDGDLWLRSAVENASEIVTVVDPDGTLRYANLAFGRVLGYDPAEVLGTNVLENVHPEDLPYVLEKAEKALSDGGVRSNKAECRFRHKDGSWIWLESVGTYLLDDPAVGGVVVNSRDVTARKEAEYRFGSTFEDGPVGVAVVGLDRRYLRVNRALCEMLGYAEEELLSKGSWEVTHPEDRERSRTRAERTLEEGGRKYTIEMRYIRSDGQVVWAMLNVSLVRDLEGNPSHFVSHFQDVTRRKETEEALRRSEERYRNLVENVPPIIYIQEPIEGAPAAYDVMYMSPRVEEILGYPARRFKEDAEFWNRLIHPDDLEAVVGEDERTDASGEMFSAEYRMFHRDGRVVWVRDEAVLVGGTGDSSPYWQGVISDVSERKLLEARIEHQALHDSLTDLPNRRLFVDRLVHALERTRRRRGIAVLFMDLDGFKVINDSLGHEAGDLLLVVVAQRLRHCLRPEDTLARFGGDEFVVLIEDVDSPGEAVKVAERITEELRRPFVVEDRHLYASASVGVALGTARTKSPEDLLRDADTAMYRAKGEGGGFRVFDPAMYDLALRRLEAENDLRRAVEQEEFVVQYQPIFDFGTGRVWALEALVRWNHPERGLLDPSEFVAVCEETGLIVPIGSWVLEEACLRTKEWQQNRSGGAPLGVIVNLSAKQLRHPECVETIRAALAKSGLAARSLTLDVTETAFMDALEGGDVLGRIRALGVRISIDDFGMDYSSLSYLKRLPAEVLKIDESFVKGFGEDTEDTAIIRMLIEMAHTLGLKVVAEGVETWAQAALLAEAGCDMAQGYHFAEPLPPEATSEFLND